MKKLQPLEATKWRQFELNDAQKRFAGLPPEPTGDRCTESTCNGDQADTDLHIYADDGELLNTIHFVDN